MLASRSDVDFARHQELVYLGEAEPREALPKSLAAKKQGYRNFQRMIKQQIEQMYGGASAAPPVGSKTNFGGVVVVLVLPRVSILVLVYVQKIQFDDIIGLYEDRKM